LLSYHNKNNLQKNIFIKTYKFLPNLTMVAIGKRLIACYLAFITDMQKFHPPQNKKMGTILF